jgi:hypothetical protein
MVRVPALRADPQLISALLDDFSLELFELELLPAPIAHSDRAFAGCETVCHAFSL